MKLSTQATRHSPLSNGPHLPKQESSGYAGAGSDDIHQEGTGPVATTSSLLSLFNGDAHCIYWDTPQEDITNRHSTPRRYSIYVTTQMNQLYTTNHHSKPRRQLIYVITKMNTPTPRLGCRHASAGGRQAGALPTYFSPVRATRLFTPQTTRTVGRAQHVSASANRTPQCRAQQVPVPANTRSVAVPSTRRIPKPPLCRALHAPAPQRAPHALLRVSGNGDGPVHDQD